MRRLNKNELLKKINKARIEESRNLSYEKILSYQPRNFQEWLEKTSARERIQLFERLIRSMNPKVNAWISAQETVSRESKRIIDGRNINLYDPFVLANIEPSLKELNQEIRGFSTSIDQVFVNPLTSLIKRTAKIRDDVMLQIYSQNDFERMQSSFTTLAKSGSLLRKHVQIPGLSEAIGRDVVKLVKRGCDLMELAHKVFFLVRYGFHDKDRDWNAA